MGRRGHPPANEHVDRRAKASVDAAVLHTWRGGSSETLHDFYRDNRAMWLRIATRITKNKQDAEDLLAEAFARTLEATRRGAGPTGNMSAYIIQTMRNLHTSQLQSFANRMTCATDDVAEAAARAARCHLDSEAENYAEVVQVRRAMHGLPQSWRNVLWLKEVEGMSPQQLSAEMGISPNAVSALAVRARNGLRSAYAEAEIAC